MTARDVVRILGVAVMVTWAMLSAPFDIPSASADPCPASEVVFARGTGEPPGVGGVGQAFIDAVNSKVPSGSVGVYPVNYPAIDDYRNSATAGANDASAHIESLVANCPDTKIVLGGYSQGAMVMDMSTNSLPPRVADHVAAVVLFGNPSSTYSGSLMGGPLPTLDPAYRAKSVDFCIPDDIICAEGGNMVPHLMYPSSEIPDEAAAFAVRRL
jgi:cutinase